MGQGGLKYRLVVQKKEEMLSITEKGCKAVLYLSTLDSTTCKTFYHMSLESKMQKSQSLVSRSLYFSMVA